MWGGEGPVEGGGGANFHSHPPPKKYHGSAYLGTLGLSTADPELEGLREILLVGRPGTLGREGLLGAGGPPADMAGFGGV